MCSVTDGDSQAFPKPAYLSKLPKTCVKCPAKAKHSFGTNASFCSECFDKSFTHKFRAAMGKNPIVRNGEKVLIGYSGGISSSALLHLVKQGLSPSAPKKLKFFPGLIFVDESSVIKDENTSQSIQEIKEIMQESGFPYHMVKLEEVFLEQGLNTVDDDVINEASDKLQNLIKSTSTLTAKSELVYRLRCQLLSRKALLLNYQHVFLAENSTRLAIKILSNVAQGRGAHLSQDTGFSDGNRFEKCGVNLLRPLRDISSKEIVMYIALHKIKTVFLPNLSTKENAQSSIPNLTEAFIQGLMRNFPSTEMTVYRLSNKVRLSEKKESMKSDDSVESTRKCCLCLGFVTDRAVAGASAEKDLLFSDKLLTDGFHQDTEVSKEFDLLNVESDNKLCYSCSLLVNGTEEFDFVNSLPSRFSQKYTEEKFLNQLKDVIIED